MNATQEFEKTAIQYLKDKRELLFEQYLDSKYPIDEKIAYFTAGPSGVGKTEFIQKFLEFEANLVHLDIDIIRDFLNQLDMIEKIVIYFKSLQVGVCSFYLMKL